jgi:hypothetical protein
MVYGKESGAELGKGDTATFWVYSAADAESTIRVDTRGGQARLAVNGQDIGKAATAAVSLSGGINKVTVTGTARRTLVDRVTVTPTTGTLRPTTYEAENARRSGTAEVVTLSQASGDAAVLGIGGEPGNGNTLTFPVRAASDGVHAVRIRYANPEQSEATHYNPDPLARHADVSVNGGAPAARLVPALVPPEQLLGADRLRATEQGHEHDLVPVRGAAELRRRDLRVGRVAGCPAQVRRGAGHRPDHRGPVRAGAMTW